MEEILKTFSIDWRLIGIQIFNFGLLLAVLTYFLYKPVLRIIEERRMKIEQGIKDADEAKARLATAEEERALLVKKAHTEASEVAARAKEYADEKSAALVKDAEAKSARIIEDAKSEGALLKERIEKESQADIAKTALLAAEKILKERA